MEWTDEGIVLSAKPHGETSVVLEVFTRKHGRHSGLLRGGRSKKNRPVIQAGNLISLTWKARLADHLGFFTVELLKSRAAYLMDNKLALAGANTLGALTHLLPERDPHTGLYDAFQLIFEYIDNRDIWPVLLARWEMEFLNELGFGLDLSTCAATGNTEELIYVSPKSGKAVSAEAGEPYKDKLLELPDLLTNKNLQSVITSDLLKSFKLTGFFIDKYILSPRDMHLPESRNRFLTYLQS